MSRTSPADLRRRQLARRVAALDSLEPRAMITEGLFSLGLGLGTAGIALLGPKTAGAAHARYDAEAAHRRRPDPGATPTRRRGRLADLGAPGPATALSSTRPAVPAALAPADDWLTLDPVAESSPSLAATPGVPAAAAGGAAPEGGGSGPVAGGAIRPLRTAPPPDLSDASSALMAAGGDPAAAGRAASSPATPSASGATPEADDAPATFALATAPAAGSRTATATTADSALISGGGFPSGGELLALDSAGIYDVAPDTHVALGAFTYYPVYTLNYNDGNVFFPGAVHNGNPGRDVDLRAQARDTTGVSFSWDTSGLGGNTGPVTVSGANSYRLQFQWNNFVSGGSTSSVTLTATDGKGRTETQVYTFAFARNSTGGSGGGSTVWPESLAPDLLRPDSPEISSHNVAVDPASGAADAVISLPAYSPNFPGLALTYNSLAADPRPIVLERHVIDDSKAVPSQVTAALTFNGTTGATSYYDTSQFTAGDVQQAALQASAVGLGTGRYSYTVSMGDVRGGTTTTTTATGNASVVDESGSAIGSGWVVAGLGRVYAVTGGAILALGGRDRSLWFSSAGGSGGSGGSGGGSGGTPTYTAPPGDFSTLAAVTGGYTRTMSDGTVYSFDSNGRQTSVADRNGLRVTYAYDLGGKLATVTDPYGKITTFAYDGSNRLLTITDPAARVATFAHTGANLTAATLPDSAAWAYAYDGSGRLTAVTDPRSKITTLAYDAANRVATITRPDATAETFVADQVRGFVAGTSSGSPGAATLLAEARGSHTDPNGHTTDIRPDWRGMGLANQVTDPDGFVSTRNRDSNGLATVSIDRLNRISLATYDGKGNTTQVVYPDGAKADYTYNSLAEVTTATDPNLHATTYAYDGTGNLTVVEDALHNRTTLTYTGNGRLATRTDALGRVTSYAYDSQDRLTTVTYPLVAGAASNATTLIGYDSRGNVATATDERGNSTTYAYDALNRLTGTTDSLANRTTIAYDSGGNPTQVQAPTPAGQTARTTAYTYDSMDRVVTVTDPLSHATVSSYDSVGNLRTVTDPLGRTTTYGYDALDRRTVTVAPLSGATTRTATVTYDAEGQVVASADFLNRVSTMAYNARGWLEAMTDPLGNESTYAYSATGRPTVVTDPSHSGGTLVSYGYDALDRQVAVTDALGHTTTTVYDAVGNVTAVQRPLARTVSYAYDARDRRTTVTDALGHATVTAYDSGGNATSVADPISHVSLTAYDALNRPTTLTDARSAVTTIAYDAAGRRVGLTDPNGNATSWAYDAADRLTTVTATVPPGVNGVSTLAYDAAGQLVDRTDRDGRRTTFAYDSGGRQINERWLDASGGTVRTMTFAYDAADQLTGAQDPDSLLTFSYDSGGRQVTAATSGPGGQPLLTLTSGYDELGARTSLADSLSSVGRTTFTYDAAHRLVTIARSHGGSAGPRVDYAYDAADRLSSQSRTIGGSGTAVDTTLAYDAADRLTTLSHQVGGGGVLATYLYGYDDADRLTGETNAEGTVAYAYDNADQLTGVTGARSESYGYDSGGNRNTTGYATAAGNELTASPGVTYAYDAQGNQTGQTETGTGNVTTFAYDYRNRLTGATAKDSLGAVIMRATYTYDALDRRIGTAVDADGAGLGAEVQTWTAYDGVNTYADFDGAGTLATRYLYGPAVDALLARTSSGGTTAWYLTDKLGSVRDIASTAGSVIDHVSYDSYGVILNETNPNFGDRFKFASGEHSYLTNIQYHMHRNYNGKTGRWIETDPIGFDSGQWNLYAYCSNSPTNYTDRTGLTGEPQGETNPEAVALLAQEAKALEGSLKFYRQQTQKMKGFQEQLNKIIEKSYAEDRIKYCDSLGSSYGVSFKSGTILISSEYANNQILTSLVLQHEAYHIYYRDKFKTLASLQQEYLAWEQTLLYYQRIRGLTREREQQREQYNSVFRFHDELLSAYHQDHQNLMNFIAGMDEYAGLPFLAPNENQRPSVPRPPAAQ